MLEFAMIRENLKQERRAYISTNLEKQGFKKKILEKAFVKSYRSHYDEVRMYEASIKELK